MSIRNKINDWLARNQDHVFERSDMSTNELLFQCELDIYSAIKIPLNTKECWSSTKRT